MEDAGMTASPPHASGQHPFLNRDGSVDVYALCRHWDDQLNHGASRATPNPIPDPRVSVEDVEVVG
jgi:hypothetical protein